MPDYLPHTDEELAQMLGFLGLASLDELFAAVPAALRLGRGLELADGSPEPDVLVRMEALGEANRARADRLVCFAGGGAYDHEVPPVVRALAGRSEFVTSYTPYQPEVAQGILQSVFEFQTMVARLAGLPVANASLYDGANALVEAVNLGVAASGRLACENRSCELAGRSPRGAGGGPGRRRHRRSRDASTSDVACRAIGGFCREIPLDIRDSPRCDNANSHEQPLVVPQLPHT